MNDAAAAQVQPYVSVPIIKGSACYWAILDRVTGDLLDDPTSPQDDLRTWYLSEEDARRQVITMNLRKRYPSGYPGGSRNGPIAASLDQGGWAEDRGYDYSR